MRRYSPSCLLGLLIREWRDDWQAISDALDCVTINVNQQILNPARAKAIKRHGPFIAVFYREMISRASRIIFMGRRCGF